VRPSQYDRFVWLGSSLPLAPRSADTAAVPQQDAKDDANKSRTFHGPNANQRGLPRSTPAAGAAGGLTTRGSRARYPFRRGRFFCSERYGGLARPARVSSSGRGVIWEHGGT